MSKLFFIRVTLGCMVVFALLQSCKKDKDTTPPPAPITNQSFTQSFESLTDAQTQGWVFTNRSDFKGSGWRVRSNTIFYGDAPFDGTKLLYSNYLANTSPTGDGNISDWAISPARIFQNGDKISFYALSNGANDGYPDRLQLRLNLFNTSAFIDTFSTDVGHFTIPLLDINPNYSADPAKFPTVWTKYTTTITGLNKPDSGRFAIRYYLEVQGGANGDELAIDKVEYVSASQ